MAFFPREFYAPANTGFHPLFRLLDDFDTYTRQTGGNGHHRKGHLPTFQPKFDVRELEDAFELHGELAGLNKQDVSIEFTEPQTMVVRGRVERTYQSGSPTPALEDTKMTGAITEGFEEIKKGDHQPTVEDAADDETSNNAEATPATTVAEVAKPEKEEKAPAAPKAKFWVSERSVGEFSRTFNFPGRIDQDNVSAKLEDGILTVRVPKAPKHEARRINVV